MVGSIRSITGDDVNSGGEGVTHSPTSTLTSAIAPLNGDAITEAPFYVGPGCDVAAGAHIGPDTVLVGEVTVAAGARIRASVVWRGTAIGPDAEVEESWIGPGVRS